MKKCWCGNEKLNDYSEEYYKCDECHTLLSKRIFEESVYDVENEQEDLYGENYWEVSMTKAAGKNSLSEVVDMYLTERVIYWLKYVLKYVKLGSDIAEVGCGLGQLQYVLRRLEYKQLAFELSPHICAYMEDNLKVKTHCGEFVANPNGYDGILAFDLFEHLINPLDFIDKCTASLRDNGVLCFQTPSYNPKMNYKEMISHKSRFREQLKAEQHIYLYSRESISRILNDKGFSYIVFEPAFFGDDYDMFFFASKHPIKANSEKEIDDFLNSTDNGRLVKAMIALFDAKQDIIAKYQTAEANSNARMEQISQLTEMVHNREADCEARQEQIDKLTEMVHNREADCEARQEQIDKLTEMLKDNEVNRVAELEQNNTLTQLLKENEADRAARLEQINTLTQQLKESEADRVARLEQINTITQQLQESEADRSARLEQINTLTQLLTDKTSHD